MKKFLLILILINSFLFSNELESNLKNDLATTSLINEEKDIKIKIDETINSVQKLNSNYSLKMKISNKNITTNEIVYSWNREQKVSELIWESNLKVLEFEFNKKNFFKKFNLTINYGFPITNNGYMEDYDWAFIGAPTLNTHWSKHPNTLVEKGKFFDIYFDKKLQYKKLNDFSFLLGFNYEYVQFKAYDGYGTYYGSPVSFSGLGITFDQEFYGPYIGFKYNKNYKDIDFNLITKYSPLVFAEYSDNHHFRNFIETSNFDFGSMIKIMLNIDYNIDENNVIGLEGEYVKYFNNSGDRIRHFYDDDTYLFMEDMADLDSKSINFSITYKYKF